MLLRRCLRAAVHALPWLVAALITGCTSTALTSTDGAPRPAAVSAVEKCAGVQEVFEAAQSAACRCFTTGYRGDRTGDSSWIGCTRQELRPIFTALSAFENTTTVSKLWLWDCSLPVLSERLFTRIRPITLKIEDSTVRKFGRNVFRALGERLENLELKGNSIIEVDGRAFAHLRLLKHLDLSGNVIDVLDVRSFGSHDMLETLLLQRNKINRIADGTFQHLTSLKRLSLANNNLSKIGQKTLAGLTNLEVLSLEHNQIDGIEPGAFDDLTKLKVLSLANNLLRQLSLASTPHLEQLFLQRNAFLGLDQLSYGNTDLRSLHTLSFDKNFIRRVGESDLSRFPALRSFSAAFNLIERIEPAAFKRNGELRTVSLQGNNLTRIDDHLLLPVLRLENLILTANRLTYLGERTLYGLRHLKLLSLARNEIKWIDRRAFAGLFSLERLYLNGNKLKTMENDTLLYVSSTLLNIDLSDNAWLCNCSLSWLAAWVKEHHKAVVGYGSTRCDVTNRLQEAVRMHNSKAMAEAADGDEETGELALPPYAAPMAAYADLLGVICADESASKHLNEVLDAGHSVWITVMAVALAVISLLILAAIAVLYMQEFRRMATLDLLARNYDLRRVPSDMVNLISPGGGFVGPAAPPPQPQQQPAVHGAVPNKDEGGGGGDDPPPPTGGNGGKEKKHVTFAPADRDAS